MKKLRSCVKCGRQTDHKLNGKVCCRYCMGDVMRGFLEGFLNEKLPPRTDVPSLAVPDILDEDAWNDLVEAVND